MTTKIPSFYNLFFTKIDPLICFSGILTTALIPTTFLESFFPSPHVTPETRLSLHICAGFFASTLLLQLTLLHLQPIDTRVWKALQAAILVQDVAVVGAFLVVKSGEGMGWTGWRVKEWGNLVVLGVVGGIRGAFLLGVGMGGLKEKKR